MLINTIAPALCLNGICSFAISGIGSATTRISATLFATPQNRVDHPSSRHFCDGIGGKVQDARTGRHWKTVRRMRARPTSMEMSIVRRMRT
jgi:hypothetical protein